MIIARLSLALAAGLLASTAVAQTVDKPLNLTLPPDYVTSAAVGTSSSVPGPAVASFVRDQSAPVAKADGVDPAMTFGGVATPSSAHARSIATARSQTPPPAVNDAPGVYYGDHSADVGGADVGPYVPPCDDSAYNTPQVHGSISTGIVTGSHIGTGNFSGGVVTVSKAFGSCDRPSGGVSISVGGTTGNGFGRHWRH